MYKPGRRERKRAKCCVSNLKSDAPRCANTDCPLLARGQDSLNLIQMLATMLRSFETAHLAVRLDDLSEFRWDGLRLEVDSVSRIAQHVDGRAIRNGGGQDEDSGVQRLEIRLRDPEPGVLPLPQTREGVLVPKREMYEHVRDGEAVRENASQVLVRETRQQSVEPVTLDVVGRHIRRLQLVTTLACWAPVFRDASNVCDLTRKPRPDSAADSDYL